MIRVEPLVDERGARLLAAGSAVHLQRRAPQLFFFALLVFWAAGGGSWLSLIFM